MAGEQVWTNAKLEAKRILAKAARNRTTISYTRFVGRMKSIKLEVHGDKRLDRQLDEISVAEGLPTGQAAM